MTEVRAQLEQQNNSRMYQVLGSILLGQTDCAGGQLCHTKNWFRDYHYDWQLVSPIVQFATTHYAFRDFCKKQFADYDSVRCATILFFQKPSFDYDRIMDQVLLFNNYKTGKTDSLEPLYTARRNSELLLYFGLLVHLLQIRISPNLMVLFAFASSIYFLKDIIYLRMNRYGVDTSAYLHQAG